jgi:hypothetical protein
MSFTWIVGGIPQLRTSAQIVHTESARRNPLLSGFPKLFTLTLILKIIVLIFDFMIY